MYNSYPVYVDLSSLKSKIQGIRHWMHLFNYINKHRDHKNFALINCNPAFLTPEFFAFMATAGLLQPDHYEFIINRTSNVPSSVSKKETQLLNKDEIIRKIQSINNWKWMYNYIKKHPEHLNLCLVWCSWEVFDSRLILPLVQEGLLVVDRVSSDFDGTDARNISFRQHCYLLYQDAETTYQQQRKLQEIDDIVPGGIL